jgi:hypothetical protein
VQSAQEQWAWLRGGHDVGPARMWNDPDLQQLCSELKRRESTDVVIALTNDGGGPIPAIASGAVCYYARHHRLRLASPLRMWVVDLADYPALPRATAEMLPAGTLVVVRREVAPLPGKVHQTVFENHSYQLVRIVEPGSRDTRH